MTSSTDELASARSEPTLIADGHPAEQTEQRLIALALGLSYAGLTDDGYARELARSHDPELLLAARRHLHAPRHLPPTVTDRASRLLDRALAASRDRAP